MFRIYYMLHTLAYKRDLDLYTPSVIMQGYYGKLILQFHPTYMVVKKKTQHSAYDVMAALVI